MAVYNTKGKIWQTEPINMWEYLKSSFTRFFRDGLDYKVKYLQLTDVPAKNIEKLQELECLQLIELDLNQNNIQTIPKFLGNFTTLKILDLSNNKIEYLPSTILNKL